MDKLVKAVEELDEKKVINLVKSKLAEGADPLYIQQQMEKGMTCVGERYERGKYFIADLIMAGTIFKETFEIEGMRIETRDQLFAQKTGGKILLGTVHGDLHDIGKNIFKDMAEARGFEVLDLGTDVSEELFVERFKVYRPYIIGMSAVLTSAVDSIKKTIGALERTGLRDQVKILIGGLAVTRDICTYTGADGYTNSSIEGVSICKKWTE